MWVGHTSTCLPSSCPMGVVHSHRIRAGNHSWFSKAIRRFCYNVVVFIVPEALKNMATGGSHGRRTVASFLSCCLRAIVSKELIPLGPYDLDTSGFERGAAPWQACHSAARWPLSQSRSHSRSASRSSCRLSQLQASSPRLQTQACRF